MMKLKPLRQYSEADVINGFFALNSNTGDEGQLVSISSGWVNGTDNHRDIALTSQANVVSNRRVLKSEVKLATSGQDKGDVLGMLLVNVRSVDYLGRDLMYDDVRKVEANAVVSGEAVKFVKRGLFLVSGYEGVAGQGSGIAVSNSAAGVWRSYNPDSETTVKSLGQFLGSADTEGYALAWLDC